VILRFEKRGPKQKHCCQGHRNGGVLRDHSPLTFEGGTTGAQVPFT